MAAVEAAVEAAARGDGKGPRGLQVNRDHGQEKAACPVIAWPMMSWWISFVPS